MASQLYASRLAGEGINVFEIRPGIIETDMVAPVIATYRKLAAEGLLPQGRLGLPEDVAMAYWTVQCGHSREPCAPRPTDDPFRTIPRRFDRGPER